MAQHAVCGPGQSPAGLADRAVGTRGQEPFSSATVFSTFPGLTQMLPAPERFSDVDLYDLDNWPDPSSGLMPREDILRGVEAVRRKLAPGDDRFFLIAGFDQETVTGLRTDGDTFTYLVSNAGDGTVPLDFARLPDVATFYIAEGHVSLPNNRIASQAVLDRETGLVWERSPNVGNVIWRHAQNYCNQKVVGNRLGWRLPTIQELASLIDPAVHSLPPGHPFDLQELAIYWSTTTDVIFPTTNAYVFQPGATLNVFGSAPKENSAPAEPWCVRGGQIH